MKQIMIGWQEYQELVDALGDKINFKKNKFDLIVAINRGGNVLGTMLSYRSEVPLVVVDKKDKWWMLQLPKQKILLVDDLSDTGKTFLNILECNHYITSFRSNLKTACMHVKKGTKFTPDYFAEKVGREYIVYPYE